MKTVVLDTSALMRLFIPDGDIPSGIDGLMLEAEKDEVVILAPSLAIIEAGQVVYKKWKERLLTDEEAEALYADIRSLPVRWCDDSDFAASALKIALDYDTTVYDALFLAVARFYSAILITVDQKLKKTAKRMNLETES